MSDHRVRRSVPDPLAVRAAHDPDAPALHTRSARWTRRQLLEAVSSLVAALVAEGVGDGRRVASLLDDDAPAVMLIHALRGIGAVHIPLNRRAAAAELAYQLEAAGADVFLVDRANADLGRAAAPRGIPVLAIEALLAGAPCGPETLARRDVALDAPATILFTSGTTGRPLGAILTHDAQRASAHAWAGLLHAAPGFHWLACLPLFHVAGLAVVTRATRWGSMLTVHDAFRPGDVSAALAEGVTHVSLVPTQLQAVLAAWGQRPAPPSLRAILLGGGPIPPGLLQRARAAGFPVLTTYGMTETGSGVACGGGDPETLADPSALRPLPGVELRVEPDGAPDGSGEILVRGPMLFAGYADDAAGTDPCSRDGWLHTGDIGTLDGHGLLRVLDRRDDLIVSGGENIYPAEVEAVLLGCPGVREAAVYAVPDARWGSVPEAAIVTEAGRADDETLTRHCRDRLAAYKVPRRFVRLHELPRNAGGKVLRRNLQRGAGSDS